MLSRLFKVAVAPRDVAIASKLLRAAGFGSIVEDAQGDRVELATGIDRLAHGDREAEAFDQAGVAFARAAASAQLGVECRIEVLSDDWETAWTRELEPVQLTPELCLVPHAPPDGRRRAGELYLSPALAFGFGEHPTTRMAVRWLAEVVAGRSLLDVGTGSGVLTLAAAHFGARAATGIDIDPRSVEAARGNAALNDLQSRCSFSTAQLGTSREDFDVVVANIDARTLCEMAADLRSRVTPGGCLALTGIIEEQVPELVAAFERVGIRLEPIDAESEWVLLGARL